MKGDYPIYLREVEKMKPEHFIGLLSENSLIPQQSRQPQTQILTIFLGQRDLVILSQI